MRKKYEIAARAIACWALVLIGPTASFGVSDFKTIDTDRLRSMVVDNVYELEAGRTGKYLVIDARPIEEYGQAHIFGAINIPENKPLDFLPSDKRALLVVYCNGIASGTSRRWAERAASAGYSNIAIYSDGFPTWKEKHLPVLPFGSNR